MITAQGRRRMKGWGIKNGDRREAGRKEIALRSMVEITINRSKWFMRQKTL